MEMWILFGSFTLLLLIGTPVAYCLGAASLLTVLYMDLPPIIVFQRMNSGVSVFSLMAIPLFIFAGDLMVRGGIATRIVAFAGSMIGHVRGGLGQVNIAASTLFGGISGSAVAEAAAVGGIMIPQMKARGYDADYAVNITAMASLIAILIPPSHNLIIYSISAGGSISIADLFTAGILPGFLLAGSLMVAAWIVARKRGYPTEAFPGWAMVAHLGAVAIPGILLIAIIFGGVRSGIFTATESSCVAVLYAIAVTYFVYRELDLKAFLAATAGAVRTTAMVLLIIGTASAFSWLMAFHQVPAALIEWMKTISDNPIVILLIINIILLLLGTFMDMGPTIIITTPIFLPIAQAYGIDPVQFGIIMILNCGIGLNTPPVGAVQFVACAVGKISVAESMRTIWPFYGAGFAVLMLVTYVPAVSLWLPALFR